MSDRPIQTKKFNWLGFLFTSSYYAGYGKYGKSVLLTIVSFIPFCVFFVGLYAGFRANKELPVKQVKFKWFPAIAIPLLCSTIMLFIYELVRQTINNV